jgi:hypothetical protein
MSTKFVSPLLGYNNNVRHKGRVFHIQTEDSGAKYGHIITHLFMDGGRILKSVKTSYSEYVGNERMGDIVREMMKQQHKAMFIALRDGKFDSFVDGTATPSLRPRMPEAGPPSMDGPAHPSIPAATIEARGVRDARESRDPRLESSTAAAISFAGESEEAPPTAGQPAELMLDIEALERAALAAATTSSPRLRGSNDLPPPPANLLRERRTTGKYRVASSAPTTAEQPTTGSLAAAGPGPASAPVLPARRASARSMTAAGERRYAPTRPASIFGQVRPQQGKSIFGEDLISDKSLDEVILSYLAEDLDEKK